MISDESPESVERRGSELLHLVAERRVPVNQPQDVAVDAAARRQLGKDGRLHLFLPLLHDHLAGLPLPQHLLVPLADLHVNLQSGDRDTNEDVMNSLIVCAFL